ncbi:uncharacterized protein LOC144360591 [Saccoglossus kowalevskii]
MDGNDALKPFNPIPPETATVRWERWIARFDNYLVAKNITQDARKRALLLHLAGEEVFEIHLGLEQAEDETYVQLKTKLSEYFAPKRNVEYEVYVFRQASQLQTETLDKFAARLRQLAKNCEFHEKEKEIKSQIIQKCINPKIREKGLRELNFSLDDLLKYGRSLEATTVQAHNMSTVNAGAEAPSNVPTVHRMTHYKPKKLHKPRGPGNGDKKQSCWGCGGKWPHDKKEKCPAWGKECRKCHKQNHFAKYCKSQGRTENNFISTEPTTVYSYGQETYNVDLYRTASSISKTQPYRYNLQLNGVPTTMEIDTGAAVSLISEQQFKKLKVGQQALQLHTEGLPRLRTYAGNCINPLGQTELEAREADTIHKLKVLVVPGNGPNLIGRDWLEIIKLDWPQVFHLDGESWISKHPKLFEPGLGTLKDTTIKLHVNPEITPRYMKARTVPFALYHLIK